MGKRRTLRLIAVEHDRELDLRADAVFFYGIQNGMLMALREEGLLTEAEYRRAEGSLRKQSGMGRSSP